MDKRIKCIVTGAVLVLSFTLGAPFALSANQSATSSTGWPTTSTLKETRASRLIGMDVRNDSGERLGDIYDLVMAIEALVSEVKARGAVWLMVPAGEAVDQTICALLPRLAGRLKVRPWTLVSATRTV